MGTLHSASSCEILSRYRFWIDFVKSDTFQHKINIMLDKVTEEELDRHIAASTNNAAAS